MQWSVLSKPENDFLASTLTKEDRHEFRSAFISAILHTDMSMHMKGVLEFETSVKNKRSHSTWFSNSSKEDRKMLLDMARHVSDLGNPRSHFRSHANGRCASWRNSSDKAMRKRRMD
jgi:hypothetical protein